MKTSTDRPEVSLDEQIARLRASMESSAKHPRGKGLVDRYAAILASLLELQRIRAAEVPGPVLWEYVINGVHTCYWRSKPPEDSYDEGTLKPLYGPDMLAYADRMRAERDAVLAALNAKEDA